MDASEANATFQVKIVQTQSNSISENNISAWLNVSLKPNSPDIKLIQSDKQIGIDTSREIKEFFTTTPIHLPYKIVVIKKAETLTLQAQQALLKILEEPPSFGQILLITHNPFKLLATVRSRCQIIVDFNENKKPLDFAEFNLDAGLGDRLIQASKFSTKEKATEHIQSLIWIYRQLMLSEPNPKNVFNLTVALFVQKMLKHNVSGSLAMDYLYLMLR